jgi:hypothetical protein
VPQTLITVGHSDLPITRHPCRTHSSAILCRSHSASTPSSITVAYGCSCPGSHLVTNTVLFHIPEHHRCDWPCHNSEFCVSFSDPMLLGTLKYATYKPFTSCLARGALQLPAYAVAQCAAWRHSVCLMKYHPLGTVGTCCCEAAANGARGCWASAALVLQHWNITPAGTHCSSAGCKPSSVRVIVTRTCSSASKWP